MYETMSNERKEYLKKKKLRRASIFVCQISALVLLGVLWEVLANLGVIDSFIMSQPSRIAKTFLNLSSNRLHWHLWVTCYETLTGFFLGVTGGTLLAVLLWWSEYLSKVLEPFLVVLNSLPKIALGPVIIIWVGAGTQAIIVMALAISTIVTVLEMLNGFLATDPDSVKMAQTFGANRGQVFAKIILPSNLHTLFNSMKINIGLSLVGVIAGEFLVSKAGLGYLIVYGGQVFQLDLVMTSVLILAVMASLLYKGVLVLEKYAFKAVSHAGSRFL